jgi:HEAT repeat protein
MQTIQSLISGQTDEGVAAARLYCRFSKANLNKVIKLLKNIPLKDKISLAQALADTQKIKPQQWLNIYKENKVLSFTKIALKELSVNAESSAVIAFLKKIINGENKAEKAVVARSLKVSKGTYSLISLLLKDSHPTVRAFAGELAGQAKDIHFQKSLIQLTQDKDSNARKSAIKSLRYFPTVESTKALYKALSDVELLCQKVATASLLEISKKFNITAVVAAGLSHGKVGTRRWSAHLLGQLNEKSYGDSILKQLQKESDFDARTEQVYALGQFRHALPEKMIQKLFVDHERVRRAFMHYLGKINNKAHFKLLDKAAMEDTVGFVRWAALEAMGNNGDPWFNKTLLAIMKDLNKNDMRDYQDRSCACWAAGKIRGLEKKLIDQMILFMKSPTIPVVMGPNTYDNSQVLLSISFAFADQYHRGGEKKDYFFKFAKFFHFRFTKDNRSVDFPRSYQNDNYADQAWSYLNNEKAPRVEMPQRRMSWDFKTAKK